MYKDINRNYFVVGDKVVVERVIISYDKDGKPITKIVRRGYKLVDVNGE